LQRVALILALGKPANVYLLDEPSAYLDSEQRIITAKVIKRYLLLFYHQIIILIIMKFMNVIGL
jgi:ATP-binding cassette subfamily E protein 1